LLSPAGSGSRPMMPAARYGPVPGSQSSPACWTLSSWRGMRVIVRKEGPPARRTTAVHRHRRAPLDLLRHRRPAWAAADLELRQRRPPGAKTASATPKTPGCATCPARVRPEPEVVRTGRHGQRTSWLDADALLEPPTGGWEPKRLRLRIAATWPPWDTHLTTAIPELGQVSAVNAVAGC
jgi:hypothetical protein